MGFGIKGGKESGRKLIESVKAVLALSKHRRRKKPNRSPSINYPSAADPRRAGATGVTDDYIRLSIGIEDPEDIIEDLDQALKTSAKP